MGGMSSRLWRAIPSEESESAMDATTESAGYTPEKRISESDAIAAAQAVLQESPRSASVLCGGGAAAAAASASAPPAAAAAFKSKAVQSLIDPRSPSGINRTPILVQQQEDEDKIAAVSAATDKPPKRGEMPSKVLFTKDDDAKAADDVQEEEETEQIEDEENESPKSHTGLLAQSSAVKTKALGRVKAGRENVGVDSSPATPLRRRPLGEMHGDDNMRSLTQSPGGISWVI